MPAQEGSDRISSRVDPRSRRRPHKIIWLILIFGSLNATLQMYSARIGRPRPLYLYGLYLMYVAIVVYVGVPIFQSWRKEGYPNAVLAAFMFLAMLVLRMAGLALLSATGIAAG